VHLGRPAGSNVGDDLAVAAGEPVGAIERGALASGDRVALAPGGAPQDTTINARSKRSIAGR